MLSCLLCPSLVASSSAISFPSGILINLHSNSLTFSSPGHPFHFTKLSNFLKPNSFPSCTRISKPYKNVRNFGISSNLRDDNTRQDNPHEFDSNKKSEVSSNRRETIIEYEQNQSQPDSPDSQLGSSVVQLGGKALLTISLALGFAIAYASAPRGKNLGILSPPAAVAVSTVDSPFSNARTKQPSNNEKPTSTLEELQQAVLESRAELTKKNRDLFEDVRKKHEFLLEQLAKLTAEAEFYQEMVTVEKAELEEAKMAEKPRDVRKALDGRLKQAKAIEAEAQRRVKQVQIDILDLETSTATKAFEEYPSQVASKQRELEEARQKLSPENRASEATFALRVKSLAEELDASSKSQNTASIFNRTGDKMGGLQVLPEPQLVKSKTGHQLPEDQEEVLVTYKGLPGLPPNQKAQVVRTPASIVAEGAPAISILGVSNSGEKDVLIDQIELEKTLGWLKWAQLERRKLKKRLLANPVLAREYAVKKQGEILAARDRVMAKSWLDKQEKRWEMTSEASIDALENRLLAEVHMRHDKLAMYVKLKADSKYYFVDLRKLAATLRDVGGMESIILQMQALGVPTTIERMWVPLRDWDPLAIIQLPGKVAWWGANEVWRLPQVQKVWPWYRNVAQGAAEEIFLRFVFPVMPHPFRVLFGLEYSSTGDVTESAMSVMSWLAEAERRLVVRNAESQWAWWLSLPVRSAVGGYPLYYLVLPPLGFLLRQFLPKPLKDNETQYKQKLKWKFIDFWINNQIDIAKEDDPIRRAFDNLKRVRQPELRLSELVGLEAIESEVDAIVGFLRNPGRYKKLGARPPRGVLIAGPSGSGKTTLALAIAAEAGVPIVEVGARDFDRGEFVGQGAASVRELFKMARETAPVIVFIEEFDQFAGVRGSTLDASKQEMESMLNQVLVELDGFETQEGVVLLATTKKPWAVDPALRRPGRMDRLVELPMPNASEREAILRNVAKKTMAPELQEAVDWRQVSEQTGLMLPPELKLVPDAIFRAASSVKRHDKDELRGVMDFLQWYHTLVPGFLRGTKPFQSWERGLVSWLDLEVTPDDIRQTLKVLDFTRLSSIGLELQSPDHPWNREYKYPHAVWAAGRGLLAALLPDFDAVENIWLTPESWEGIGFTRMRPQLEAGFAEAGIQARTHSEKRLTLLFGSHCAAVLLLPWGQSNSLATPELREAQSMAASMVVQQGWSPDGSPMIYKTPSAERMSAMGFEHMEALEGRAQKLYELAAERAGAILTQNKATLEALVEHLLIYDAIDEEGLRQLILATGGKLEEGPFMLSKYNPPTENNSGSPPTWRRLPEIVTA